MKSHPPTSLRLAAWTAICGISTAALLHAETFPGNGLATADGKPDIRFDFLEPGFTVRELPVRISNLNNIEYARDGRLFAVGYDGRVHVLRDTDGDGQEDTATLFWQGKGDYEMPLGLVVRDDSVYVTLRRRIERLRDTDGDGVADQNEVVATGWHEEITQTDKTFLHRRVDDAIGLAIDPQGNFYTSLGCANYQNLYQVDADGKSRYSQERFRGSVVKVAPGGKPEIVASGVRFLVSMQFNKVGDLFATDQEGATWGPGNPFDELLHLQRGRHYGFPPRHPEYLPDVFDEPSVVDFGPQHQSTCGFRFDEERAGFRRFGPKEWEGNAIVTGESRGKLWRVPLARTRDGYVGKPVLICSTNMMPIDVTIAPNGDLLVCCHGGIPDWGTGPKGEGRVFRISHTSPKEPRLAAVWPSSLTELRAAFTEVLPKDATFEIEIGGGRYVRAGDDLETFRPGYGVVKGQQAQAPRHRVAVTGSRLSEDGRSVIVTTSAHPWVGNYGMMLRWKSAGSGRSGTVRGDYDFHGVRVTWTATGAEKPAWIGWLPYANLDVARAWTLGSSEHDAFFAHLHEPGRLRINGTFEGLPEEAAISLETTTSGNWDWNGRPAELSGGKTSVQKLAEVAQPFAVELETSRSLPTGWLPISATFTQRLTAVRGQKLRAAAPGPISRSAVLLPGAPALPAPDAPAKPKESPAFVRGDLEKGRQAFTTTCAICHSFRGQGAKVGPDLSNSPERDASGLLEDIVKPSATLNPDYIGYELVLKNDTTVVGSIASDRPGRFLVQQPGGALIEVQQADIKTMRQLPTSLMPAGFEGLGEETLRNIITYLITPAGE